MNAELQDGVAIPSERTASGPQSLREAWIALAGLSAIFLFEMLDNSILNVALPTIGRDLHASTTALQWVTSAYMVVFGGLMLVFGAIADRFGRRRVMLTGLVLLGLASLATAFVSSPGQLIAVRATMGIAAAMTTPGSMALAFRLFDDDRLRIRAITVISTVGLVGLAIGPTVGGFVLSVAPWQILLLINVPIAILAFIGVRLGIAADDPAELHPDPVDSGGALLGTATIVFALIAPTFFVDKGVGSWMPWAASAAAIVGGGLFIWHERSTRFPLIDLGLVARPLVSSGLAYNAATGLAVAGLGYMATLLLQLDWGWSPAHASIGMLPQVLVLLAGSAFVDPFIARVGQERAAVISASAVVSGLLVFGLMNRFGYLWVAVALVLVSAGLRVVGVVAGMNVLQGLPEDRTTIGAALVDTSSEVTSGIGIAITGTLLAAMFTGDITTSDWTVHQVGEFQNTLTLASLVLTGIAAALVSWGYIRAHLAAIDPVLVPTFGKEAA
ncbi:MAG: MFS transporter [Thermomicrobiales bacterium]